MTAPDGAPEPLTGPRATALLVALLARTGDELLDHRLRSVDHRPGRSTTVAYDVRVRGPRGERPQVVGASVGLPTEPGPGVLVQDDGVAAWRFPHDPSLPGLAAATDEDAVRGLLVAHGVEDGPVEVRTRSYRPRRRAVVEVRTPASRVFLKVLPSAAVRGLHDRHVLLRSAGLPVPRSLGCTSDGVLLLEALDGVPLRVRLRDGGDPVPDAVALLDLLDRLPQQLHALPHRPSWSDDVAHSAGIVAAALPEEADRCARLADRVIAVVDGLPPHDAVHGDLHEGQLLLDGGRLAGLLDLDTAGPGRRADDLAGLLAHLGVLASHEPAHRATTTAVARPVADGLRPGRRPGRAAHARRRGRRGARHRPAPGAGARLAGGRAGPARPRRGLVARRRRRHGAGPAPVASTR